MLLSRRCSHYFYIFVKTPSKKPHFNLFASTTLREEHFVGALRHFYDNKPYFISVFLWTNCYSMGKRRDLLHSTHNSARDKTLFEVCVCVSLQSRQRQILFNGDLLKIKGLANNRVHLHHLFCKTKSLKI